MAATAYYNSHPQNPQNPQPPQFQSTFPSDYTTSYEPYRQAASSQHHPQYPFSLSSSPNPSSSDRGFLTPSHPTLKKSKSERAIKFVEKQVKKQIDKKLHGGHGHGEHAEEQVIEASQQDSSGSSGGEYGYGDAGGGYGPAEGIFGGGNGGGNFEWAGSGGDGGWLGDLDLGGFEG